MAALTDKERSRIMEYLLYPDWNNLAMIWGIFVPTHVEPQYYIRDAMDRLTDEALELVRKDLCNLEDIELQMADARKRLKASKVGDITLNPDELDALQKEFDRYVIKLANKFGAPLNGWAIQGLGPNNGMVIG
jgi:Na+/phosphate symporter